MEIIAWIGFAQGLFAAVLMFSKREQMLSDRILSVWLMLLAVECLTSVIDQRIYQDSLLSSSFLLFNPALFIYIRSLVSTRFRIKWSMLLHLLPFLVLEITAYSFGYLFTFKNFFQLDSAFAFRISVAVATVASTFIYLPLSILILLKYRRNLQNEKSNIDMEQNLNWLLFVSVFYTIYSVIAIVLGVTLVLLETGDNVISVYNYAVLLVLIYIISFYGLSQKQIEVQTDIEGENHRISYKNSILSSEVKQQIKEKIIRYFENEKAYLNPNLNMDLLSEAINYPKYQITEVLNVEIGKSFFQFVNSYRIEAVKKMLAEPKLVYSVEAIGYECGFNSKSSFYTVFKNITGETPVTFRKRILGKTR